MCAANASIFDDPVRSTQNTTMPKSCCVTRCTVNKLKNPELRFYKLPSHKSQPLRRQKWIQAIRREASAGRIGKLWDPDTQYAYVCSKHFVYWRSSPSNLIWYVALYFYVLKRSFLGSTAYKNIVLFFFSLFTVHLVTQQLLGIVVFFVISQKWQGGSFPQYKVNGERWIAPPPNKHQMIFDWITASFNSKHSLDSFNP